MTSGSSTSTWRHPTELWTTQSRRDSSTVCVRILAFSVHQKRDWYWMGPLSRPLKGTSTSKSTVSKSETALHPQISRPTTLWSIPVIRVAEGLDCTKNLPHSFRQWVSPRRKEENTGYRNRRPPNRIRRVSTFSLTKQSVLNQTKEALLGGWINREVTQSNKGLWKVKRPIDAHQTSHPHLCTRPWKWWRNRLRWTIASPTFSKSSSSER